MLSYYKTFHKIQQKRLTNLFINYLQIVNVRWLSSSVKARPFLMSYQKEMFSQSTCTKSHKNITIAFNIPSRKTNHLPHYFVTSLKFLPNFVFKRFPNRLFLRRGKIGYAFEYKINPLLAGGEEQDGIINGFPSEWILICLSSTLQWFIFDQHCITVRESITQQVMSNKFYQASLTHARLLEKN